MTNLQPLLKEIKELLQLGACLEEVVQSLQELEECLEVVLSQLRPQSHHLQQEGFLEVVLSQQMQVSQLQQEVFLEEVPNQPMHQPLQEDYLVEQLNLMQISQLVVQYLEDLNQHKQITHQELMLPDNLVQLIPNLLPMKLKNSLKK